MQPKHPYAPRPTDRFLGTIKSYWGSVFDLYLIKGTEEFFFVNIGGREGASYFFSSTENGNVSGLRQDVWKRARPLLKKAMDRACDPSVSPNA